MSTIVTLVGQAKIADAIANQTDLALQRLVVGDGNGAAIDANETMTELVNEVYDVQVSSVTRDNVNTNWVIVEGTIAEDVGPFTIREVGILDADGDLFAVAAYPATEKFSSEQGGVTTALTVRMIIVVSDSANVTVELLPGDYVVASRRIDTGPGLSGGGDLTQDREHVLDFLTLDSESAVSGSDLIALYDVSAEKHVRMTRDAFVAGLTGGESGIDGGANIGDGGGQSYSGLSGSTMQFRRIKAGAGVAVATTGDNVVVSLPDMAAALTA